MVFGDTEERLSQFGDKWQILNAIREHYLMKRSNRGPSDRAPEESGSTTQAGAELEPAKGDSGVKR